MGYTTRQQSALDHPVDDLLGPASNESSYQVSAVSELLSHILHLQPREEMDIVMKSERIQSTSGPLDHTEHRGYLMDIELGEVPTICVKRTF
jgi:hypothetical protein